MFKLLIVKPDEKVFEGEVRSLRVPGVGGGLEILSNHAPLVAALKPGKIRYDENVFDLRETALLEVGKNTAKILVSQ
jgi:F0F1-type ATP synthase epsilon subunit